MALMQKFQRYVQNKFLYLYICRIKGKGNPHTRNNNKKKTFIYTDGSKMHNNRIILFFIETGKLRCILYCIK